MNYRHAFHAGNFADCVKHVVLVWLLRALRRKPAPVFVLDTHAGAGSYDLAGEQAERTREAEAGIERLMAWAMAHRCDQRAIPVMADGDPPSIASDTAAAAEPPPAPAAAEDARPGGLITTAPEQWRDDPSNALADFLALVRGCTQTGSRLYPGSPQLIRMLLRPDDRLACCELRPDDHAALRRLFARDPQVSVHHRDGWEALGALLPPKQRRALVLIDPPYEAADEFARLLAGLRSAHARMPTAILAAWYPIKTSRQVRAFHDGLRTVPIRDAVAAELLLREPIDPARLNGCGLLVVNPPYRFEPEAAALLRHLLTALGDGEPAAAARTIRLTDE